jgi:type 1 glutamine amidotransferase
LLAFVVGLADAQPKRILYITTSAGYRHASIETSIAVLEDLSRRNGQFEMVATEDVSLLNAASLEEFDGVLFFTSGELPVSESQKSGLLEFVWSGKGFMGVHSATDTFYTWPEYGDLIGARFNGHPWVQPIRLDLEDPDHPATVPLRPSFPISEEIYQFRAFSRSCSRVLMSVDPTSVDLTVTGVNPNTEDFPSAWCHLYGTGRVFYTALGHFDETWRDERFQRFLLEALRWITHQVDGNAAPRNPDPPAIAPQGVGNSATLRPPNGHLRRVVVHHLWDQSHSRFGAGGGPALTA